MSNKNKTGRHCRATRLLFIWPNKLRSWHINRHYAGALRRAGRIK